MPHPSADTTRQAETFDSAGGALLEFEAEPSPFIVGPAPSRAAIPPSPPVTRATVSPRVAFVLGFLLATSMAWLVNRPWGASTVASAAVDSTELTNTTEPTSTT